MQFSKSLVSENFIYTSVIMIWPLPNLQNNNLFYIYSSLNIK